VFEPQSALWRSSSGGEWSDPERVLDDGFIAWRAKSLARTPTVFGYRQGVVADDRRRHAFTAAVPGQPVAARSLAAGGA